MDKVVLNLISDFESNLQKPIVTFFVMYVLTFEHTAPNTFSTQILNTDITKAK